MSTMTGSQNNHLEQINMNMPEVAVYFSGETFVTKNDISVSLGKQALQLKKLERSVTAGDTLHYYIDLDISASISHEEFANLCSALTEFGSEIRSQDRITLITFGDEVNKVLSMTGEEIKADQTYAEKVMALRNDDQHTLFFEALDQTARMITQKDVPMSERSVMCVITDGEDIATGKASRTEALTRLQQAGLPLYAFTTDETSREYINSLGEFARNTGGSLATLTRKNEIDGFKQLQLHLLRSYKATLQAGSNQVTNDTVSLTLKNTRTAEVQRRQVLEGRWTADIESPVIKSVERCSARQLRVMFSEAVQGLDAADSYRIVSAGNGVSLVPAYASAGGDKTSAILTFSEEIKGGEYVLRAKDITDISMEQNRLMGEAVFMLDRTASEIEAEKEALEKITEEATEEITEEATEEITEEATEEITEEAAEEGIEAVTEEITEAVTEEMTEEETESVTEFAEASEEMTEALTECVEDELATVFVHEEVGIHAEEMTEEFTEEMTEEETEVIQQAQSMTFWNLPFITGMKDLSGKQLGIIGGAGILGLLLLALLIRKAAVHKKKNEKAKKVTISVNGSKEELQVTVVGSMIVGRSEHCDLRFSDPRMSRQHFALGLDKGKLVITNLSQSGYTTVNGKKLEPGEYVLRSGDVVGAGSMRLKLAWS